MQRGASLRVLAGWNGAKFVQVLLTVATECRFWRPSAYSQMAHARHKELNHGYYVGNTLPVERLGLPASESP